MIDADTFPGAMVAVEVDSSLCQGHGRCYASCPEVFAPDEEGFAQVVVGSFERGSGLEAVARLAVGACPEHAITVSD